MQVRAKEIRKARKRKEERYKAAHKQEPTPAPTRPGAARPAGTARPSGGGRAAGRAER